MTVSSASRCAATPRFAVSRCMGNIGHRACSSKRGGLNDTANTAFRHEVHPVASVKTDRWCVRGGDGVSTKCWPWLSESHHSSGIENWLPSRLPSLPDRVRARLLRFQSGAELTPAWRLDRKLPDLLRQRFTDMGRDREASSLHGLLRRMTRAAVVASATSG
jgi:hypothetical protein